jgi:homoserine dehydrogenase
MDAASQEPHPADDLNGADIARKLTILSRIIPALRTALPAGYKSVKITSLVPPGLDGIPTGDEFLAQLPASDGQFDNLRAEAAANGEVLRYVGVIDVERGEIKASLEKYVTSGFPDQSIAD